MKTKKILMTYILFSTSIYMFAMGKRQIDYSEYEKFVIKFSEADFLTFEEIKNNFYDDSSCVRLLLYYYSTNTKEFIESDQTMAFSDSDDEKIKVINRVFLTLGKIKKRKLTDVSVKNIYDVPVSDLYCLTYEVKFENSDTVIEQFWLKKKEGKIRIYRYTFEVNVYK